MKNSARTRFLYFSKLGKIVNLRCKVFAVPNSEMSNCISTGNILFLSLYRIIIPKVVPLPYCVQNAFTA